MSNHAIMQEFEKSELIEIAKELDLTMSDGQSALIIIEAIRKSLREEGIPAEEDCSDLLDDFLFVAGYIDESGEIIDEDADGGELGNVVDSTRITSQDTFVVHTEQGDGVIERDTHFVVDGKEVRKPPCYGFAEERDPACKRCRVFEYCQKVRMASRPACYGKLFSATDENCNDCLEAASCKIVTLEQIKVKEN